MPLPSQTPCAHHTSCLFSQHCCMLVFSIIARICSIPAEDTLKVCEPCQSTAAATIVLYSCSLRCPMSFRSILQVVLHSVPHLKQHAWSAGKCRGCTSSALLHSLSGCSLSAMKASPSRRYAMASMAAVSGCESQLLPDCCCCSCCACPASASTAACASTLAWRHSVACQQADRYTTCTSLQFECVRWHMHAHVCIVRTTKAKKQTSSDHRKLGSRTCKHGWSCGFVACLGVAFCHAVNGSPLYVCLGCRQAIFQPALV